MQVAEVVETNTGQAVRLPDEFRFATNTVTIRRNGDAVILEPVKSSQWPANFFENIRIDDPAFRRPEQGALPPAPSFEGNVVATTAGPTNRLPGRY